MNNTNIRQRKKKGRSVQDLIGIKTFSRYGLVTNKGELLFFLIAPTNISVMSRAAIDIKINHLYMLLSTNPELEIICSDSAECFDDNKAYLQNRLESEKNPSVKTIIEKDIKFLDDIQIEMSTARQFFLTIRCKQKKPEQILHIRNEIEKAISNEGFEVHRMSKKDIKRFLALYFDASMNGELIPDIDGEQYIDVE
ncbi:MAG: hypothetical protein IKJ59_06240 [Clostridia bacterium]|nr:hypothetical protein [Clostridia bacterium]